MSSENIFALITTADLIAIRALLESNPSLVNCRAAQGGEAIPGSTPLHLAVEFFDKEVVKLLIEKGGDVNASEPDGTTVLHVAVRDSERSRKAISLLISAGADPYIPDDSGETPADIAMKGGVYLPLSVRKPHKVAAERCNNSINTYFNRTAVIVKNMFAALIMSVPALFMLFLALELISGNKSQDIFEQHPFMIFGLSGLLYVGLVLFFWENDKTISKVANRILLSIPVLCVIVGLLARSDSRNAPAEISVTSPSLSEQSLPWNGTTRWFTLANRVAPFKISARNGMHYFVKVVDASSKAKVVTIFVRGGDSVNIDVPVGSYQVR